MTQTAMANDRATRLRSLDALRGVAALVVLLYHYTRRYGERFDDTWRPWLSYDGQFGVLLFFMISGYVITLTTYRVRRPIDFVFFRFSRLYPTFWVCLAITTAVVVAANFPPQPTPFTVAVNATMLAKSIRRLPQVTDHIPYVDGSYWSLEIELFFYAVVFALLIVGQTKRIVAVANGCVLLGLVNLACRHFLGRPVVPSMVEWVLFLEYWPYFGLGIATYAWQHRGERVGPAVLAGLSLAAVAVGGWAFFLTILICAAVFVAAVYDVLPPLRWRLLVGLGVISYPLYLLHQNIGYVVIRAAREWGLSVEGSIGVAVIVSLGLATAVTFAVERPSMHLLRRLYAKLTHRPALPMPVSGHAPVIPITAADKAE